MNNKERYSYLIGKTIRITSMPNDPREKDYIGREGVVDFVDDMGQLHGSWGGLAVLPTDGFVVLD